MVRSVYRGRGAETLTELLELRLLQGIVPFPSAMTVPWNRAPFQPDFKRKCGKTQQLFAGMGSPETGIPSKGNKTRPPLAGLIRPV